MKRYWIGVLGFVGTLWTSPNAHGESSESRKISPYIKISGGGTQGTVDGLPSGKQKGSGPTGFMATGIGYTFQNGLYLGGEAFIGWSRYSIESMLTTPEGVAFHSVRKAERSLGGCLHLGYVWNLNALPSLIYGRMGIEQMRWTRHAYGTESSTNAYEDIKRDAVSPTFWVPGIGWRHHLTEQWAVGFEYQYALGTGVKKLTRNDKPKWSFQRLMWSVGYHF